MAKEKARYFTFLLYPESIPQDWQTKLETLGVPIAISPLHDKDLSSVEGQKYKKPIITLFISLKSCHSRKRSLENQACFRR